LGLEGAAPVALDTAAIPDPQERAARQGTAVPPKALGGNPERTGSQREAAVRVADPSKAGVAPDESSYRIGVLDVLEISVFKVPELSKSV
jgi:polysaccharide export outer membrane protein